jgi:hypothetical protein
MSQRTPCYVGQMISGRIIIQNIIIDPQGMCGKTVNNAIFYKFLVHVHSICNAYYIIIPYFICFSFLYIVYAMYTTELIPYFVCFKFLYAVYGIYNNHKKYTVVDKSLHFEILF